MNFYAVLGLSCDADDEAIRRAYRILARRYHPDHGLSGSAEKFRQVRQAYEALMNPARRRSYDHSLELAAHRPVIRIESPIAQSSPFYKEDPRVFGRFAPRAESSRFQDSIGFEDVLATCFRSLEDLFYEFG